MVNLIFRLTIREFHKVAQFVLWCLNVHACPYLKCPSNVVGVQRTRFVGRGHCEGPVISGRQAAGMGLSFVRIKYT